MKNIFNYECVDYSISKLKSCNISFCMKQWFAGFFNLERLDDQTFTILGKILQSALFSFIKVFVLSVVNQKGSLSLQITLLDNFNFFIKEAFSQLNAHRVVGIQCVDEIF